MAIIVPFWRKKYVWFNWIAVNSRVPKSSVHLVLTEVLEKGRDTACCVTMQDVISHKRSRCFHSGWRVGGTAAPSLESWHEPPLIQSLPRAPRTVAWWMICLHIRGMRPWLSESNNSGQFIGTVTCTAVCYSTAIVNNGQCITYWRVHVTGTRV